MTIVLGNIIALIGSFLMIYVGLLKKKKKIIFVQTIQIGLLVISNIILGGITGAITNSVSCLRNILCYKNKYDKKVKIGLIILSVALSLSFNNLGFIGLLPVISNVLYTWLMDTKSVIRFKYLVALTLLLWFIYDLYIMSYTSAIFDLISSISNLIGIYEIKKSHKRKK
ncbi:MAG: YgjV family protein [Bacilli bacterium]|nr:YgjV family protein [Bacilli bacterium]